MTTTIPLTTAFFAAILGFLGAALTVNVILSRVRTGVDAGDGGVATLAQAIRAHANFIEQAPLALLILAAAELSGVRLLVVELLGTGLIIARLSSAYALNRSLGQTPLRQFGGGASVLLLVVASIATLLALGGIR
jgi:uncharacterized membrane protein YecN with MAPEG domain